MYQALYGSSSVRRLSDGAIIAPSDSQDWLDYIAWCDAGNTPASHITLEQSKQEKIEEFTTRCEVTIKGGFTSSALGHDHIYDSDIEDQINLIGVMLASQATQQDIAYKCLDTNESIKEWEMHTPTQISQVYMDGLIFKSAQLHKLTTLKTQINNCTSIEEVNSISW